MQAGKVYHKVSDFFRSIERIARIPWYSRDLMIFADNMSKRAREMRHDKVGSAILETEARRLYSLAKRSSL